LYIKNSREEFQDFFLPFLTASNCALEVFIRRGFF
jgi:hypothetical protein